MMRRVALVVLTVLLLVASCWARPNSVLGVQGPPDSCRNCGKDALTLKCLYDRSFVPLPICECSGDAYWRKSAAICMPLPQGAPKWSWQPQSDDYKSLPTGWLFFDTKKTFKDAWKTCEGLGGSLVAINDRRQNDRLSAKLSVTHKQTEKVFIGLRNFDLTKGSEANPKNWAWAVNDKQGNIVQGPATFADWETALGMPTSNHGSCAVMLPQPGIWWNEDCNTPHTFVCDLDL